MELFVRGFEAWGRFIFNKGYRKDSFKPAASWLELYGFYGETIMECLKNLDWQRFFELKTTDEKAGFFKRE